nr:hypothetical protein [Tanacetum cinerariifolium]
RRAGRRANPPRARRGPGSRAAGRLAAKPRKDNPPRQAGGEHRARDARAQPGQHGRAPAHRPQRPLRRVPAPGLPRPAGQG